MYESTKNGSMCVYESEHESDLRLLFDDLCTTVHSGKLLDNFKFHDRLREESETNPLKTSLGVDRKGKVHSGKIREDMRQKESKPIPKRRLHRWFTDVIDSLKSDHECDMLPFPNLDLGEFEPSHPISRTSRKVVSLLFSMFKKTRAAFMASKYINLGSRIGGSYLNSSNTRNPHSFTSMMPVYATVHGRNTARAMSGVIIRGPQHARGPTDKINLVVIETVSDEFIANELWKFLPNCAVIKGDKNSFVVRKTAMNKMDSSYYAFNLNALFATCNSLGEMVFNKALSLGQLNQMSVKMLQENGDWFKARIVESLLMSWIGNTRDEGIFSLLRKLFMALMAYDRKTPILNYDQEGFANKINECVVDNPIGMYFLNSFLFVIRTHLVLER